jgi:hypothetical protein
VNQELKDKLLQSLNEERIQSLINDKKFHYQKTVDKLNELIQLPKLGEKAIQELQIELTDSVMIIILAI